MFNDEPVIVDESCVHCGLRLDKRFARYRVENRVSCVPCFLAKKEAHHPVIFT